MRSPLSLTAAALLLLFCAAPAGAAPPAEVELVLAPGAREWPGAVRAQFEERVRAEWPAERGYGALLATLGVELGWPLVTGERSDSARVPVVEASQFEISGRLLLPPARGPRRVVVLVDASSSANALATFEAADGAREKVSVLEAERRALEHLVDGLASDWLEFGVIAFGESVTPIAEPGASAAELRESLARFRAEQPAGVGRTDAVCALWTAWDWLEHAPDRVEREIVVLTDGDAPISGRFSEGPNRNQTPCPATHTLSPRNSSSDPIQMVRFGRQLRGEVTVTPLIFEPERRALPWRQLAERTGGALVRVPGPQAIDAVLPALVASRIERVTARNATTGAATGDLLQPDRASLAGRLPLAPGANDVELTVASDRGAAALFRFRIYSAPGELERALAELRERNRALEVRAAALDAEARANRDGERARTVGVRTSH